jgi:hypothetical protein
MNLEINLDWVLPTELKQLGLSIKCPDCGRDFLYISNRKIRCCVCCKDFTPPFPSISAALNHPLLQPSGIEG